MLYVTVQDVGALMGGAGTLYAAVRGIPMLSSFLTKQVTLVRKLDAAVYERDAAIANARRATDAATAFDLAAKGWKTALEAIGDEVNSLRSEIEASRQEVRESREELHATREELRRTRELLASAILYITNLHTFMRLGGNMPQMPADLRAQIDTILEDRKTADAEHKEHP